MTPQGAAFIKQREGCEFFPYQDAAGVWTIGYGHIDGVTEDTPAITQAQCDRYFDEDAKRFVDIVERLCRERTGRSLERFGTYQKDALTSFAYNIGVSAFKTSNVWREALNQRAPSAPYVPALFLTWTVAGGAPSRGLVNRRVHEYNLFRFGDYS